MTEAVLLKEEERGDVARKLSLEGVVHEALTTNLTILAEARSVAAGAEEVRIARSGLRPQLSVGALGRIIDGDRADAGRGSSPQRAVDASASITQLVYSDGARANVAIQRLISTHDWHEMASLSEDAQPLRVSIGLHAGEAIREAGDFYGNDVNLAARIANEAQGGEILVSARLRELTESAGDITFDEGREVELKGLGQQRVFQVGWE